jgi:hypothetical protein
MSACTIMVSPRLRGEGGDEEGLLEIANKSPFCFFPLSGFIFRSRFDLLGSVLFLYLFSTFFPVPFSPTVEFSLSFTVRYSRHTGEGSEGSEIKFLYFSSRSIKTRFMGTWLSSSTYGAQP